MNRSFTSTFFSPSARSIGSVPSLNGSFTPRASSATALPAAGEGGLHVVEPDGERGVAAGLVAPERRHVHVVAEPDAGGEVVGEPHEPGVERVVGGAGLAGGGLAERRGAGAGPHG